MNNVQINNVQKGGVGNEPFIAFFYSGLGFALFSCGTRFVARYFRYVKE